LSALRSFGLLPPFGAWFAGTPPPACLDCAFFIRVQGKHRWIKRIAILSCGKNRRPPVLLKGYAFLNALFAKAFHVEPPIVQDARPSDKLLLKYHILIPIEKS
jgi:hypothetical protein